MLVYRDGSEQRSSAEVVRQLQAALAAAIAAPQNQNEEVCIDALLRAGELECALADLNAPSSPASSTLRIAGITDAAAAALLGDGSALTGALAASQSLALPSCIRLKPPEGFAFYALHPRLYARLIGELQLAPAVAVIGIRSIGATLSAVVAAAARADGYQAQRITVRPAGHPYNRELSLSAFDRQWIA